MWRRISKGAFSHFQSQTRVWLILQSIWLTRQWAQRPEWANDPLIEMSWMMTCRMRSAVGPTSPGLSSAAWIARHEVADIWWTLMCRVWGFLLTRFSWWRAVLSWRQWKWTACRNCAQLWSLFFDEWWELIHIFHQLFERDGQRESVHGDLTGGVRNYHITMNAGMVAANGPLSRSQ